MGEVIAIPPVLAEVIAVLRTELTGRGILAPVSMRVPNPRPEEFVRVIQTASRRESITHAIVTFTVEAWARSQAQADVLGSVAYALATSLKLPESHAVPLRDQLPGPYQLDDPETGLPRCVFSFQMIVPTNKI